MKKALIAILLVLFVLPSICAAGGNADCMMSFYKTNDMACVSVLLEPLRTSSAEQIGKGTADLQAIVGFLAEIFRAYPKDKERILKEDASYLAKSIYIEALCRAGMQEEAKKFAEANGLSAGYNRFQSGSPAPIKLLKSNSRAGDNDLLIGAYMATGEAQHISNILENFTSTDDAMAGDAFRIGLMMSKFGFSLTPKWREPAMTNALCQKYECKIRAQGFLRVITLSSAFWSLQSLGQKDEGIRKIFGDFFASDSRLKSLLVVEQSAFMNYLTTLAMYAAIKDNPNINSSLSIYENLGAPEDAHEAMFKRKN